VIRGCAARTALRRRRHENQEKAEQGAEPAVVALPSEREARFGSRSIGRAAAPPGGRVAGVADNMKLIGSHASPYVRKVRIALAEKRIEYDFVLDNPHAHDSVAAQYNPLGKIPVLVTDDGTPVYDSSVIVEYLDMVSPVGRLIPEAGRARVQAKRWEALADGLLEAAVLVVVEKRRPVSRQSKDWIERQMSKVARALSNASHDLGERGWCAGEGFGLADLSLGCALGYLDFRFPDLDWRVPYPNLARHAEKLFRRPPFLATSPQDAPAPPASPSAGSR
jgi:glutathione S-transferase